MRDFPLRGSWREQGQVYHDYVIVYTVIDFDRDPTTPPFFTQLKAELKELFRHKDLINHRCGILNSGWNSGEFWGHHT